MATNKEKPAADTPVRLTKVSEPLSEPMAECLQALAGMALASANQVTGVGQWSEVCLSLQVHDDGSVETAVFYTDRLDDETDSLDLPAEEGSSVLRKLSPLVAGLERPWCAVQIDVRPDGSYAVKGHRPDAPAVKPVTAAPAATSAWGESPAYDALLNATTEARQAYFRTLGEPDADHWFPLINPAFQGGPAWPTRPAWQRIRNGKQTVIASSGLTDPFADVDGPNVGHGVEVAVATADEMPADLRPTWLLELVQAVSHQAAEDGRFHLRHAKFGVFLFGVRGASDKFRGWLDDTGTMGFLVGVPMPGVSATIPLPAGSATLLVAKLLTPGEYEFVAARGLDGAQELVQRFTQTGTHHLSSLGRESVV